MSNVIELSKQLISLPSVTPAGANCIELLAPLLEKLGFNIELIPCGPAMNLYARLGKQKPLLCFLGHVDVVPTGPVHEWISPPFQPEERDGYLYGRGACDMKTGVAGFICAIEDFLAENPKPKGSIAVMLTSVEEDMHEYGVPNLVTMLEERGEKIDYCVTGEPSSTEQLGDIIRTGRRGSLSAKLTVKGTQGHVAFPHLADNPIHKVFAAFAELIAIEWDQGSDDFPPTSLQFSNLHAGTGVGNIIPGAIVADFNFRFTPEVSAAELQTKTENILKQHGLTYGIQWSLSGEPFNTPKGKLTQAAFDAVKKTLNITAEFSTGGGTSDARFIAPTGAAVIELGVSNKTAHKVDECVKIKDLKTLPALYLQLIRNLDF
jgi:succinyl-diaminopimelate desuccinylase